MKIHKLITQGILGVLALALLGSTAALAQAVHPDELEQREGLYYEKGSDTPYSGKVEDPGQMVGQVEDGQRTGQWKGWHENGRQAWVSEYEEGRTRRHAMWYPNGQMRFEGNYGESGPDGLHVSWREDGQKVSERSYRQGKPDGKRQVWAPEGHLLHVAQYQDGQQHGPTIWYYADGQKRWETHYEAGQRTGTWTQWTRKGEVFMQSQWDHGTLVKRTNPHH